MDEKLEKVIDRLITMTKEKKLNWTCISDSKNYKIFRTSYQSWNIMIYKAVGVFVSLVDRQDNKLYDFPANLNNMTELYLAVARESFDIDNFIDSILNE